MILYNQKSIITHCNKITLKCLYALWLNYGNRFLGAFSSKFFCKMLFLGIFKQNVLKWFKKPLLFSKNIIKTIQ